MNTHNSEPQLSDPANASPDICPACGHSNRCTLADPRTIDQPCWCFSASIDPAVLAALPQALKDKACLCPQCAGVQNPAASNL